eukprot:271656_1
MASSGSYLLLMICLCSHTLSTPILYVSPTGTDTKSDMCEFHLPCASIYRAVDIRETGFTSTITSPIEIVVYGINKDEDFALYTYQDSLNISMPLTITFRTSQDIEWHNIVGSTTQLTLNNMQYNVFDPRHSITIGSGTLILNNCSFIGINMNAASSNFIAAQNIKIYNSIFAHIIWYGTDSSAPSFIHPSGGTHVVLQNSHFEDIRLRDVSFVIADAFHDITVMKCVLKDIDLYCSDPLSASCSQLSLFSITSHDEVISNMLMNNTILNNIHSHPLLTLEYTNSIMTDVEIIVSNLNANAQYMIGVSATSQLNMTDIDVTYEFVVKNWCTTDYNHNRTTIDVLCHHSYPWLNIDDGYVEMNSIYIKSNITEKSLHEFRANEVNRLSLPDDIIFEFKFLNDDDVSLISNTGILNINEFVVDGVPVYPLEFSNKGTTIINKMDISYPLFIFNNSHYMNLMPLLCAVPYIVRNEGARAHNWYEFTCIDAVSAHCVLDEMNVNSAGILVIQESLVVGKGVVKDTYGYIGIYNTLVEKAIQVVTGLHSISIAILDCEFVDIVAAVCPMYLNNVKDIIITHNLFLFFPTAGFMYIRNGEEDLISNVIVSKNSFSSPNNYKVNNSSINDGQMVVMEGYIKSSIIGNWFHDNDACVRVLRKSCLGIIGYGVDTSVHCLSGNIFEGNAFHVSNATITSCFHPQLSVQNDTSCWTESGPHMTMHPDEIDNVLVATDIDIALIHMSDGAHVVLDQTVIDSRIRRKSRDDDATYNPLAVPFNGILSVLDLMYNQTEYNGQQFIDVEIEFSTDCTNECARLYQEDNKIYEFHLHCTGGSSSALVTLDNAPTLEITNRTLPAAIFLNSSGEIFAGGALRMDFVILDAYDNLIDDWDGQCFVHIRSVDFGFDIVMDTDRCEICEQGLFIQNLRMSSQEILNMHYFLTVHVENDLLAINNLSFIVTKCPSGYGLSPPPISQCLLCNVDEFSIGFTLEACISCTTLDWEGVSCRGADIIMIEANYWISLDETISSHCPSGYCNAQYGDYLTLSESDDGLCALNRDPSVPLCGACKEGYSEVFGSSICKKCTGNQYTVEIVLSLFTVSLLFTSLLVYRDGSALPNMRRRLDKREDDPYWEVKTYMIRGLQKPILYYYQSVAFVLLNTDIQYSIAKISNFELDTVSVFCLLDGLTARDEILANGLIPAYCIFILLFMAIISKLRPYYICGTTPAFAKSLCTILLMVVGAVCGICFKLIACQQIGSKTVHFYFGSDACFDLQWGIALTVLILVLLIFCGLFIRLFGDRHNDAFESFVVSFKTEPYCVYWELVLFTRRIMIAMIYVAVAPPNETAHNVSFILLLMYLALHIKCQPFEMQQMNTLEAVCLLCLLSIMHIIQTTYNQSILTALVLFPLCWYAVHICAMAINVYKRSANEKAKSISPKSLQLTGVSLARPRLPAVNRLFSPRQKAGVSFAAPVHTDSEEKEKESMEEVVRLDTDSEDDNEKEKEKQRAANEAVEFARLKKYTLEYQ